MTVIGAIKKRQLGMAKLMPFSIDNDMYAPFTTVDNYYTGKFMRNAWINARAKDIAHVDQARKEMKILFSANSARLNITVSEPTKMR